MGLFGFMKKKAPVQKQQQWEATTAINSFGERYDRLTTDGELPFGWIYRNKDFVNKIGEEYSYFLDMWLDTKNKSPKEQYQALKSFVIYLEDAEKLCKSKGECFEFWFYELHISKKRIEELKNKLKELTANLDVLQEEYEIKKQKQEEQQQKAVEMKPVVVALLKEKDGILQSDFWKLFEDETSRAAASDIVYSLLKEGKIERTKSGRSYTLHYKE